MKGVIRRERNRNSLVEAVQEIPNQRREDEAFKKPVKFDVSSLDVPIAVQVEGKFINNIGQGNAGALQGTFQIEERKKRAYC